MATAAPPGPHVNHYRLRRVASSAEKSCSICYKPTDCVLMSTDSKDWFYVCQSHLVAGFATPIAAPAAATKLDDNAKLEAEIAKVKKEYEAKEAQKKADKGKEEKGGSWMPSVGGLISKAASGVVHAIQPAATPTTTIPPAAVVAPEPKEFALNRSFYQHRVSLKQQAAMEKAKEQQWKTLSFPSAPSSK